jgi:MarR family transcriptional regulator, organic hydroperoxide resistance regulator
METATNPTQPPAAVSALPDVLRFMQVLWAVSHGLETTSKRMTTAIGITGPQRLVLRVVGLFPGLSAGDLATILHVHPSTLTGVLKRLISSRLLERVEDARDRRRAILHLTAPGSQSNGRLIGTVEAAIAQALSGISDADRIATQRVLGRLTDHLQRPAAPAAQSPEPRLAPARRGRRPTT